MKGPTKADYELAAMLLNNTAEAGGTIGIGPEARASLARVAAYLLQLASTTPPRSTPPPS